MTAPTFKYIVAVEASFHVHCARCKVMRDPGGVPEKMVAAGKGDSRVDQFVYRCNACGEPGTPWVRLRTGSHDRLWPLRETDSRTPTS
jgi:hypothetical protein